ncbi:Voltage-dependent T-type calcium channel subunit alpha-1G [Araneus ventricosus]|uniref:Voltage-dependent T-type calcium channel subunit alpha-1G n=1 Tax=Araneus ventricosus TaxID=182803 RepID=A0A4Y2JXD9_ARAVE|nr:Voltage-dependent T-type calcium channel subunit alpha-1G [Araneus ventricosus]
MLLLDTLPMLGNVLLLCFFVFFIFGIVGVQLWAGLLRQRCYIDLPKNVSYPENVPPFYHDPDDDESEYICSLDKDSGMHRCADLPPYTYMDRPCNGTALTFSSNSPTPTSCVNWNQYYVICRAGNRNPFKGAISFDNIGLAWVAIFLVISLEGWSDIMYYVQDAHSFWDWVYFVLLIVKPTSYSRQTNTPAQRNLTMAMWCGRRRLLLWYKHFRRKRRKEEYGRTSISLRRRTRRSSSQHRGSWSSSSKHRRSSASLNGNSQTRKTSTHVHPMPEMAVLQVPFAESPQAPCASPEISDIDLIGSPRRPNLDVPRDQPSYSGSDYLFSTDSSGKTSWSCICPFTVYSKIRCTLLDLPIFSNISRKAGWIFLELWNKLKPAIYIEDLGTRHLGDRLDIHEEENYLGSPRFSES